MKPALLLQFTRQDLIDRHASSMLGAFWTFLLPLANILIFTLVFSNIMAIKLTDMGMDHLGRFGYSVYLVSALLAWNCFAGTLTRTTQVFQEKAPLIGKVHISLFSLPLYILLSETVIYLISMSFFMVFLLIIDFQWSIHWLWWPVIFAVQQLLAYAIGLGCAILGVFLRDIREVVTIVVQLWFWMTPIVYVITILPEKWLPMFQLNPYYHLIDALRTALLVGEAPAFWPLFSIAVIALLILFAALYVGRRLERDIRDFL
ncbi:ABC transporter permease [Nitrincola alkalilacustris]|uniref:ABC transporter permease n=1 Tax=Nitrincola alkalilacustris TaxID=1571224 RepID=UPI00124E48D5|nr:ABC transporter permease [Nitrincola alkalilacustris]